MKTYIFCMLAACGLGITLPATATQIDPLQQAVWVDLEGNYYYQEPVSMVPATEDGAASVRVYEKFPYRKIVKRGDQYLIENVTIDKFRKLNSELTEHGKRLSGDFDGDGRPDLIIQTSTGDEIMVSNGLAKPFDFTRDMSNLDNVKVIDMNSDFKDDLFNESTQTVQYATTEGFTHEIGTSEYVGGLTGEGNVSPSGDFTYNIPITLAESTGGLKPNISLNYSSNPNNGHLGVGWAIGGLSAISRCEKNIETDGTVSKVDFSTNDRFCLDGQRLLVKNGQTYGANNAEYRTAQDSFQKIISYRSSTSKGPDRFVVYDKKGNVFHYGKLGSSENGLIKTSNNKHFAWALRKVEDASDNYYTFSYDKVSGSLEYYPTQVSYSAHSTHSYKNKIKFIYEGRHDVSESYIAGEKSSVTKRLKTIESYYGSSLLRKYKLSYKKDLASYGNSASSLLEAIEACDINDKCLAPTVFSWNAKSLNQSSSYQDKDFSRESRYKGHQLLDFNGDGLLDIAYVRNDRGSSTDHLYLIRNNGQTLDHIKTYNDIASKSFRRTWKVVDYDKDGDDDIIYLPSTSNYWKIIKHTSGNNFSISTLSTLPKPNSDAKSRFVDMNADGMPDLMHIVGNKLTIQKGTKTGVSSTQTGVELSLKKYYANSTISLLDYDEDDNTFTATDFNGDGKADLIVKVNERVVTYTEPGCNPFPDTCPEPYRKDPVPSIQKGQVLTSTNVVTNSLKTKYRQSNTPIQLAARKDPPIKATNKGQLTQASTTVNKGGYLPSTEGLSSQKAAQLLNTYQEHATIQSTTTSNYSSWRIVLSGDGSSGKIKLSEYVKLWSTSHAEKVMPINLNGDGLTDLVYRRKSDNMWFGVINNGNGFNAPIQIRKDEADNLATMDVDANGTTEIIFKVSSNMYFISYKNGQFTQHYYGYDTTDYNDLSFVDMDGDGVQDKFIFKGRSRTDFRDDTGANRIEKVTDGFGNTTSVFYQTLNSPQVYTKESNGNTKNWGNGSLVTDLKGAVRVVSRLHQNGDTLSYHYTGGKAQIGRGLLGYRKVAISSVASSLRTTTEYRQDGIYRGSPTKVTIEAIVKNEATQPDPYPEPTPCETNPRLCSGDLRSLSFASTDKQYASIASTSSTNTYIRKAETIYEYGVITNNSFTIGSRTKAQYVYPKKTTQSTYNVDSVANEKLVTKISELSVDSYGNPLTEMKYHTDKYVVTRETKTSQYSYSKYGGRVTQETLKKERTDKRGSYTYPQPTHTLITKFGYDSLGRLSSSTADNGVLTSLELNKFGLTTQKTLSKSGLSNRVVFTGYDLYGRHIIEKRNELGHKTRIYYTSKGLKNYEVSANGQRIYYEYNSMGRQTGEVRTPQNNTSKTGSYAQTSSKVQYWCKGVSHCPSSAVYYEEITQEGSPTARTYTDKRGNEVRSAGQSLKVGTWIYKDTEYDSAGRKISESVPYLSSETSPLVSTIKYDSLNRVIEITQADGGIWETEYDGFKTSSTNPTGHVNHEFKNGLGNVVEVLDANGKRAWYLYDTSNQLDTVTDPNSNQIRVYYDKYGNKTKIIDPDAGTTTYGYNAYHELTSQKDANSNTISFQYDKLGRKIKETRKTSTGHKEHEFVYTYDSGAFALGMVSKVVDNVSGYQEQFFYDTFSRVKEKRTSFDSFSYTEKSVYDAAGRLAEEIDASGHGVKHIYNAHNWAYQIRDKASNALYWQALEADGFGKISKDKLGGVITRTIGRNAATGLTETIKSTAATTLQNLQYEWDNKGNLTYRRDLSKGLREDFVYDALNRVTKSTVSGKTYVVTDINYNAIGNITSKSGVGTYTYHTSKPHAVKSVTGTMANSYTYDAAGNIINDNQRTFVNNSFNKPVSIAKEGYVVDFAYGVDGKRYKRSEIGMGKGTYVPIRTSDITTFIPLRTETHYIGNVEFVRIAGSSDWQAKRYIGDSILITHVKSSKTVNYLLTDHLNSTHVIAKSNGSKAQEMSFDVFGARRDANTWARDHKKIINYTSSLTLRGYTGHEQLDELGLVHMGGRIYDPVLGRFLQADPAIQQPSNIQSFNRYSYAMNNPLNKTDPSGYIWVTLATMALKAIAAQLANTMIAAAINFALTAYQFYGYYQLAKGVLTAIEGGGTAMANFAGGFAKSYVKGMLESAVILGAGMAIDASQKQGSTEADIPNAKGNANSSRWTDQEGNPTGPPESFNGTETASLEGPLVEALESNQNSTTRIQLGYTKASGHGVHGKYHAFVIATDPATGEQYITRGGPSMSVLGVASSGPAGSAAAALEVGGGQTIAGSGFGNVKAQSGVWSESLAFDRPSDTVHIQEVGNILMSYKQVVASMNSFADMVNKGSIGYWPTGPNSNSYAFSFVEELGFTRPSPDLGAPGWDKQM
ncbi:FG-GAP-like repeat-containing protein [Alteromonas sp. ASW11-130]|uniref:FG-GAP-like repeat-containing protein n=1 Tax=Alteromonas sp. ASW11-130 TaxID=3015775 RepID=UPI002241E05A|nr:FG-GAP-like repeat-containing protein [Alteromonas sp. ASW11-130]MCW8091134.1 FG-GAP-like repeat-containing protein [Alteromonas sp. ASW11-130]